MFSVSGDNFYKRLTPLTTTIVGLSDIYYSNNGLFVAKNPFFPLL